MLGKKGTRYKVETHGVKEKWGDGRKKEKKKKNNRDKGRTASSVRGKGKLEKSSISEFGAKANEQDIKTIETLSLA